MAKKLSKNQKAQREKIEEGKLYTPLEAMKLAKEISSAKFDETIEAHIRTGCDGRHAEHPWSDAGRNSRQNRCSPGTNDRFCMENWVAECINFANKNEKM